jgi:LPS export ABC transporter protein LptC
LRNREAARYARWSAIVAGLIVLAVASAYIYRAVLRVKARRGMPAAVPASVERQSAEVTYKSVEQGRTLFMIRASQATQYKDHSRALLEDVWITIYGHDGKQNDNIHTRECSYDPQTGGARCQGAVQIDIEGSPDSASGAGKPTLRLVTSDLRFDRNTGNAFTDTPVQFTFPGGRGSGVGVDYSTRDATVRLERTIEFQLAASDKTGGLPVSATGSSLVIHRDDRTADLNGPVSVRQGERELSAGMISVEFDATNRARQVLVEGQPEIRTNEKGGAMSVAAAQFRGLLNPAGWIERVIAEGNVRATRSTKAGTGHFSAGHVEFAMVPGRNIVSSMTASGGVKAQSQQNSESDTLRTDALKVTFATPQNGRNALGRTASNGVGREHIESAETLAPATIELAKGKETTEVTAKKFVAEAGADGRIEKLFGHSGVMIRRETAGSLPQIVSAPELAATLGSHGEWETVEQTGGVRMRQGDRQAVAASARIDRATDELRLEGSPVVMDGESRTSAKSVAFNQKSGALKAGGGVISTYVPGSEGNAASLGGAGSAHISAETLTGSAASGHVTYAGHARLWQGDSVLEADRIDLWRDEKKMQASGHVVAVFPQNAGPSIPDFAKPGKKATKDSGPTLWKIHAPLLTYWGDQSKARLEGGVAASSDQGTLHAQTLDVFLGRGSPKRSAEQPATANLGAGGELDRVIGRGNVVVEQGLRRGVAEQAEYTAADGKFVLSGGEPTVTDGSSNSVTGSSLTFYVASDTILIDSQQGSRTLTKHKVEK